MGLYNELTPVRCSDRGPAPKLPTLSNFVASAPISGSLETHRGSNNAISLSPETVASYLEDQGMSSDAVGEYARQLGLDSSSATLVSVARAIGTAVTWWNKIYPSTEGDHMVGQLSIYLLPQIESTLVAPDLVLLDSARRSYNRKAQDRFNFIGFAHVGQMVNQIYSKIIGLPEEPVCPLVIIPSLKSEDIANIPTMQWVNLFCGLVENCPKGALVSAMGMWLATDWGDSRDERMATLKIIEEALERKRTWCDRNSGDSC